MRRLPLYVVAAALAVSTIGCSDTPPLSRVEMPTIDAHEAGLGAIQKYDDDGNGLLSQTELIKIPGILGALDQYDSNQDGSVSADEIAQRIDAWQATKTGMQPFFCSVMLDGQPLEGAEVKFIPAAFLGIDIKRATGVANSKGAVNTGIDTSDLPKDQQMLKGVQSGIYRIEVTHPTRSIPARYNTNTVLGVEVAPLQEDHIALDLQSK